MERSLVKPFNTEFPILAADRYRIPVAQRIDLSGALRLFIQLAPEGPFTTILGVPKDFKNRENPVYLTIF
jgi:hypothetical protein